MRRDDGTAEEQVYAQVTPNIFRTLGARVVLGRDFIDSDAQPQPAAADGAPPPPGQRLPIYAIASQEFFQRRFGVGGAPNFAHASLAELGGDAVVGDGGGRSHRVEYGNRITSAGYWGTRPVKGDLRRLRKLTGSIIYPP